MSGDETTIDPSTFTAAGERIADILARAAIPVEPPVAVPGPSPADTAAANLAALMGIHIRAASAELAPRGPKIREATQAAVAEIQAQDLQNAQAIKGVSGSQSAIDTLLRGVAASGPGDAPEVPLFTDPLGVPVKATDLAYYAAGAAMDTATGGMKAGVESMIEHGPGEAGPGLGMMLKQWHGFSGFGGVASAPFLGLSIEKDMISGDNVFKATTREVTGTAMGTIVGDGAATAAPLVAEFAASALTGAEFGTVLGPGVGTAIGLVAGVAVGGWFAMDMSQKVGEAWEAAGNFFKGL